MIVLKKSEEREEEKNTCFEMANLRKQETGLPYDIWLDSAGATRSVPHNAMRIKVGVDGDLIPVIITSRSNIRTLKSFQKSHEIETWISENYDTLLKHWNGELSDRQALILLGRDS